jgi:hypothetical protein
MDPPHGRHCIFDEAAATGIEISSGYQPVLAA